MTDPNGPSKAPEKPASKPAAKKADPDPYKDYADAEAFPCVLTLATGELVGAPSVQSTEHYSPKLDCTVPVVGALAR